jgi:hypothetical protein
VQCACPLVEQGVFIKGAVDLPARILPHGFEVGVATTSAPASTARCQSAGTSSDTKVKEIPGDAPAGPLR